MYNATVAILCVWCEWRIRDPPARTESAARVSADALCSANGGYVRAKYTFWRVTARIDPPPPPPPPPRRISRARGSRSP